MTLIDRLSKLDGPNRRMDHEMHILFFVPDDKKDTVEWNHFGSYSWSPSPDHGMIDKVPAYTASVDAAIALAERVLPGWNWRVGRTELYPNGWSYVHKYDPSNCDRTDEAACADGKAANPAIALCIAILRAKEASYAGN